MRRSPFAPALFTSLLIHAALAAWLWTREPGTGASPVSEQVPIEFVFEPPRPQAAPASPPAPAPARPVQRAPKRSAPAPQVSASPAETSGEDDGVAAAREARERLGGEDAPRAESSRQHAALVPELNLSGQDLGGVAVPSGRGHTLRPDDPSLAPEVLAAEEEHRVQGRVSGWMEDTLGEARAQRGLPHPYFSGMGEGLRAGLDAEARARKLGPELSRVFASLGQRYLDSLSSYGKTGNPDLGPPGINPRQSEQLERWKNEPETAWVQGLVRATEMGQDLRQRKPMLTLTVELRQSRSTGARTAIVLQPSGDPKFDAFVLEVWPRALDKVGPPPPEAFHGPEARSVWAVEGWLRLPKKLENALSYLPTPGALGMSADGLAPLLAKDGARFEFRPRLLRVY